MRGWKKREDEEEDEHNVIINSLNSNIWNEEHKIKYKLKEINSTGEIIIPPGSFSRSKINDIEGKGEGKNL